jgi:hypothetical protein
MKLKLDIDPDIVAMMAAEVAAGERAVSAAIREAGAGLKFAWRGQITGAGLGQRLANTIRLATWPKGGVRRAYAVPLGPRSRLTLNAAALVWSNAPVIVGAHDTGPLIRSRNGFWLAIPTPAAGKSLRGGRITSGEWERRTGLRLRFIYRRRGPSLLVAEGRLNSKGKAVASSQRLGAGLRQCRSSSFCRRSGCASGWTSRGMRTGRWTAFRGWSWRTGWRRRLIDCIQSEFRAGVVRKRLLGADPFQNSSCFFRIMYPELQFSARRFFSRGKAPFGFNRVDKPSLQGRLPKISQNPLLIEDS